MTRKLNLSSIQRKNPGFGTEFVICSNLSLLQVSSFGMYAFIVKLIQIGAALLAIGLQ
jgi:hypothetical protein